MDDINFEKLEKIKCMETENCEGIQERFALSGKGNNIYAQFQCNKCRKYIRLVNGKFYSAGKYNNIGGLI